MRCDAGIISRQSAFFQRDNHVIHSRYRLCRLSLSVLFAVSWAGGGLYAAHPSALQEGAATSEQSASVEGLRIEDVLIAALHGDSIIEFGGEAGARTGVIGLVHRDGDLITLMTLASQRDAAPWYALKSCTTSEDKRSIVEIVGDAAPRECESAFFESAATAIAVMEMHGQRRDGVKLAAALMQARALRADCERLASTEDADAREVLRERCAMQLKSLPPQLRAQSIRAPAALLAWVEIMDAQQCALRLLEGWRVGRGVSDEIIHALKSIGARNLCERAEQLYLPVDNACLSLCADPCYTAMAWEIVEALAERLAAMRAGVSALEAELGLEIERGKASCGIKEEVIVAMRSDLRVYVQELANAVPTTLRMTPQLAEQCAVHLREALCFANPPKPHLVASSTAEIRCRNELLNDMLKIYGRLLHESDLLSDQERATFVAQVDGIVADGISNIEQHLEWYRAYHSARGRTLSSKFLKEVEDVLGEYRRSIYAPFENQWVTWNVFPFSERALALSAEELNYNDSSLETYDPQRPHEMADEYDIEESLEIKMIRLSSGMYGFNGLATLAAAGAGGSVIGGLYQGVHSRGIILQPFTLGGSSYGYATPDPWEPRMWFDRNKLGAPR